VVLAIVGRAAYYVTPGSISAIDAYARGVPIGLASYPDLASKLFLTTVAIASVRYISQGASGGGGRQLLLGNLWALAIVPALLDDVFDGFSGHTVLVILYIYIALRFWQGKGNAWRWGSVVGIFATWFSAQDGTLHYLAGLGSGTAAGLLKGASDLFILMVLVPATYLTPPDGRGKLPLFAALVVAALGGSVGAASISVPGGFGLRYDLVSGSIPIIVFFLILGLTWLGFRRNKPPAGEKED